MIEGVDTTIPFHQALIQNPHFQQGEYTTRFVEENEKLLTEFEESQAELCAEAALAAAVKVHVARARLRSGSENHEDSVGGFLSGNGAGAWQAAHRVEATRR